MATNARGNVSKCYERCIQERVSKNTGGRKSNMNWKWNLQDQWSMARLDGKMSPTTNKEKPSVMKKVATLSNRPQTKIMAQPMMMKFSTWNSRSSPRYTGEALYKSLPHTSIIPVINSKPTNHMKSSTWLRTHPWLYHTRAQGWSRIASPTMPREENQRLKSSQRHQV